MKDGKILISDDTLIIDNPSKVMIQMMKDMVEDALQYSEDPNTKVAAVIFDNKGRNSIGINRSSRNKELGDLWEKRDGNYFDTKYPWIVHAEVAAISCFLKKYGVAPIDSVLLVSLFPCHECAKLISEVGINHVIYLDDKYNGTPGNIIAKDILQTAGVKVYKYEDLIK